MHQASITKREEFFLYFNVFRKKRLVINGLGFGSVYIYIYIYTHTHTHTHTHIYIYMFYTVKDNGCL